jgi:endonuclease-3 related protein
MPNAWSRIYRRLFAHYGPQHWWPGDTPFEVMVGAILTQNTAWSNVERAIVKLKAAGVLDAERLISLSDAALAELIRPAGYFNVKARRLKALCQYLAQEGVLAAPERLVDQAGPIELRRRLLGVHGIGEETADSILLYALDLPSFVVDAYTRRIFGRLGLLAGSETYAAIQALFQGNLPGDPNIYNDYHALIVQLGKSACRPRPRCGECPLRPECAGHELPPGD